MAGAQFYDGRIQLLLPLCLTGDKPELALTIQREDGFYAARTCLTLDMAYNNARLIVAPRPCGLSGKWWFRCDFDDCIGRVGFASTHELVDFRSQPNTLSG